MPFYRRYSGTHHPLIERIVVDQDMKSGLGPLCPSPQEINSNKMVHYLILRLYIVLKQGTRLKDAGRTHFCFEGYDELDVIKL
jgi:hypothetical protein